MAALGVDPDRLEIPILQFVHIVEGGRRASMSKRRGDFVTLDDLIAEIGVDATRYFMLSRSHDSTVDLDLDARHASRPTRTRSTTSSTRHARIASILRQARRAAEAALGAGAGRRAAPRRARADQEAAGVPGRGGRGGRAARAAPDRRLRARARAGVHGVLPRLPVRRRGPDALRSLRLGQVASPPGGHRPLAGAAGGRSAGLDVTTRVVERLLALERGAVGLVASGSGSNVSARAAPRRRARGRAPRARSTAAPRLEPSATPECATGRPSASAMICVHAGELTGRRRSRDDGLLARQVGVDRRREVQARPPRARRAAASTGVVALVRPSIVAPAPSLQPGPRSPASSGRQRQAVAVGRHRRDRRRSASSGRGSCVMPLRASDDAAAVGQRAAEHDPLGVEPVAPQRRAAARAPRRARARAGRRSCRPSAPRAPRCRSPRRGSSVAPSPPAGNHGTSAQRGQRSAHSAREALAGRVADRRSLSSTPSSAASSLSHSQVRWSSSPVPEAIETLAAASPSRRRWTYSPGETQVATRVERVGLAWRAARRASPASSSSAGGSRCGRGSRARRGARAARPRTARSGRRRSG